MMGFMSLPRSWWTIEASLEVVSIPTPIGVEDHWPEGRGWATSTTACYCLWCVATAVARSGGFGAVDAVDAGLGWGRH